MLCSFLSSTKLSLCVAPLRLDVPELVLECLDGLFQGLFVLIHFFLLLLLHFSQILLVHLLRLPDCFYMLLPQPLHRSSLLSLRLHQLELLLLLTVLPDEGGLRFELLQFLVKKLGLVCVLLPLL